MICGTYGQYGWHLRYVLDVIGLAKGVREVSALSVLTLPRGTLFLCDTHVTPDPGAEEIAQMTVLAAAEIRRFGIVPKAALLSHADFGSSQAPSARKMREALALIGELAPELDAEGEMTADAALDEEIRHRIFPNSKLEGEANLLVFPSLDAANMAFNLLKVVGEGTPVGPLLVGAARAVVIVTPAVTARGILNSAALAVVDAQTRARGD